jgi:(p)ppGpp synthase/HD superfamily hydrolase
MYSFAQTNLQLFNQMYDLGYHEQEIAAIKKSYELAITLFTGRFRGSGKTFIDHLIGTASILVSLRSAPPMIAAGLLHAAYDSGDFGDGNQGVSSAKRDYVRAAVGTHVEEYIARYMELKWNQEVARSLYGKLDTLSQLERDVVLIRLANELEDYLDLGILFCGMKKRAQGDYLNFGGNILCEIARKLGFPKLAEVLKTEFGKVEAASKQKRFDAIGSRDFSFVAPPLSCRRLMDVLSKRMNEMSNKSRD